MIMASVANLEKKFEQLIIKDDKPFAIALTGEWGIGKTHFWQNFYEVKRQDFKHKKYAYVSLFGIETLEALKYEIAIKSHGTTQKTDLLSGVKGFFTKGIDNLKIPDLESNGFALSVSKNIISSIIGGMIKDTVICIDDLERKSDKLDIKDAMGLINQLKLENNCQIIVILHSEKADDKFKEYKEKVFDDILLLDDNLSILKSSFTDSIVAEEFQRFYNTLGIRNLRFYYKVYQLYLDLITSVPNATKTTKQRIIEQLLIIKWVDEFSPEILIEKNNVTEPLNVDLQCLIDNFQLNDNDWGSSDETSKKVHEIRKAFWNYTRNYTRYYNIGGWGLFIANHLKNHVISQEDIQKVIEMDLLSEQKFQNEKLHNDLITEYHSLQPSYNFIQRFYEMAITQIGQDNLINLSFYYDVLSKDIESNLANSFNVKVKTYIKEKVQKSSNKPSLDEWYIQIPATADVYKDFLQQCIGNYQLIANSENITVIFTQFFNSGGWHGQRDKNIVEQLDKQTLEEVLWTKNINERSRKKYIMSILEFPEFSADKKEQVREWIVELLKDKISESPESKIPIKFWLEQTNDLKKI